MKEKSNLIPVLLFLYIENTIIQELLIKVISNNGTKEIPYLSLWTLGKNFYCDFKYEQEVISNYFKFQGFEDTIIIEGVN